MWKALIGASGGILGTVTGLYNSNQDRKTAERNTDATIAAQKELAQYEYDNNYRMWQEQNAYNAPSAQMERLTAAGLNPNLVYGSGSVVGNTTGSAPQYRAPDVEYNYKGRRLPNIDIPSIVTFAKDIAIKDAQEANIRDQNKVLDAQASKIQTDNYVSMIDGLNKALSYQRGNLDYNTAKELQKTQIDAAKQSLLKLKQDTELSGHLSRIRKLDADLGEKYGMRVSDPWYMRIGLKGLEKGLEYLSKLGYKVPNPFSIINN